MRTLYFLLLTILIVGYSSTLVHSLPSNLYNALLHLENDKHYEEVQNFLFLCSLSDAQEVEMKLHKISIYLESALNIDGQTAIASSCGLLSALGIGLIMHRKLFPKPAPPVKVRFMTLDTMPKTSFYEEIFGFHPEKMNQNLMKYSLISFTVTSVLPITTSLFKLMIVGYTTTAGIEKLQQTRIQTLQKIISTKLYHWENYLSNKDYPIAQPPRVPDEGSSL